MIESTNLKELLWKKSLRLASIFGDLDDLYCIATISHHYSFDVYKIVWDTGRYTLRTFLNLSDDEK